MSKPDGGPAYPHEQPWDGGSNPKRNHPGMTLRDYFAGQAMQGVMVSVAVAGAVQGYDCTNHDEPRMAQTAYKMADAMLQERDR